MPKLRDKLSAKQQLFVREYLVDFNATQAAKRAGYSEKTAFQIGYENLKKPDIRMALKKAGHEFEIKTFITPQVVLEGLFHEATLTGEDSRQSARVAAWTTLARTLAMLSDNQNLNVGNDLKDLMADIAGKSRDFIPKPNGAARPTGRNLGERAPNAALSSNRETNGEDRDSHD